MIWGKTNQSKTFDLLGNTWTARHLARVLFDALPNNSRIRLWNYLSSEDPNNTPQPKLMLVPDFLSDHMGLGMRHESESTVIYHGKRKRDLWSLLPETAQNIGCTKEVLAILHDLVFLNSYDINILVGQKLKSINYQWQNWAKELSKADSLKFTPQNIVVASKPSIERVWDNLLTHQNVDIHFSSTLFAETIRSNKHPSGLAMIMSPPEGVKDDTDHVVVTSLKNFSKNEHAPSWFWKSYQAVISKELVPSMPRFFVWINSTTGKDFLESGLIFDGCVLRVFTSPIPHSEDQLLVQVDRLTSIHTCLDSVDESAFFDGSPWFALKEKNLWSEIPATLPDDFIFQSKKPDLLVSTINKSAISLVGISPSGSQHYFVDTGTSSKERPLELSF